MKKILEKLFENQFLTKEESHTILSEISEGKYNSTQMSAFMTVFNMRNISVDELAGFRDCLREKSIRIDFDEDTIDLCGTGGDKKDTFNISTISCFLVAGAGYKVTKHGNYGVSSLCGSSNVLEQMGYRFTTKADELKKQLEEANICFLHAPLFHPAMKNVAPLRKKMAVPTFFNMLGPMVNPCRPQRQLVGVFSAWLQRYYKHLMEQTDTQYAIVHSVDGYDEVSLTSKAKIIRPQGEYYLYPESIANVKLDPKELTGGGSLESGAKIFVDILKGKSTMAQKLVVQTNAGMAIQCYHPEKTLYECINIAKESLDSGAAYQSFKKLMSQ